MNGDVKLRLPWFDLTRWLFCTRPDRHCQPEKCNLTESDAKTPQYVDQRFYRHLCCAPEARVRSEIPSPPLGGSGSCSIHLDVCVLDDGFPLGDLSRNVAFQLIG